MKLLRNEIDSDYATHYQIMMFFASCKEKEIGVTESELITIQQAFNCANHDWDFTVYGIKIVLSPITQVEMLHKRVKSLEERVSYLENKK